MHKFITAALAVASLVGAVAVTAAPTAAAAQPYGYRHHGGYAHRYHRPFYGHRGGYGHRHYRHY